MRDRAAAVLRWVVAVEALAVSAQRVCEPAARRVDVEVARVALALVPEVVDDALRDQHERAGRSDHLLRFRAELEEELAIEDVERVGVLIVDVRFRPALAGRIARPGRIDERVLADDPHLPLGLAGNHLAFAGA
jgi:hypothetical protein